MYLRITNGMELAVGPFEAKKRGYPVYVIHADYPLVVDDKGRKGLEQYPALKYYPDGKIEFIKANPRKGKP